MIIIFQRPGMIYIICASVSVFVCMLLLGGPYILLLKGYSSLQKQSNESVFKNGIPIHSVLNIELTKKLKNFIDAIFLLIRCPQMNWKKWSNFSIQKT